MSVMVMDGWFYKKIAKTLFEHSLENDSIRYFFQVDGLEYPESIETYNVQGQIKNFCEDIYRANQITFNEQYSETGVDNISWKRDVKAHENLIALYKSLRCVQYNCLTNAGNRKDFNGCTDKLTELIDCIAYEIISETAEFEQAEWG